MKKVILFIVVLIGAFCVYWFILRTKSASAHDDPKQAPIALKKHSEAFNTSIDRTIDAYLAMKDAFIESDTNAIKQNAGRFIQMLVGIPLAELKKDTAMIFETATQSISDIKANALSLISQASIDEMRKDFSMVTEMMYPGFFKTINYEGKTLYLEHCPMAFGDDHGANWLSGSGEIVNPYLGKVHPKFKASMIHCGEVMDSVTAQ